MPKWKKKPKAAKTETSKPELDLAQLWPGQSIELLKSLNILTRDGKLNQDSRRKLKQVQHLIQFITPHLEGLKDIADLGAGKSYLGFILYDLWLRNQPESRLWSIEKRTELVQAGKKIASTSHFDRISFVAQSIREATESAELPQSIDAVTALHACDTATDEAIAFALAKNAKFIALVPCCQAEVASLLGDLPASAARHDLGPLFRHGIHRREFGSHLTNVIRSLFLESRGYKVRVTELIGWEHSMKNELILAEKVQGGNGQARKQLEQLLTEFPLKMKLFDLVPPAAEPTFS